MTEKNGSIYACIYSSWVSSPPNENQSITCRKCGKTKYKWLPWTTCKACGRASLSVKFSQHLLPRLYPVVDTIKSVSGRCLPAWQVRLYWRSWPDLRRKSASFADWKIFIFFAPGEINLCCAWIFSDSRATFHQKIIEKRKRRFHSPKKAPGLLPTNSLGNNKDHDRCCSCEPRCLTVSKPGRKRYSATGGRTQQTSSKFHRI